MPGVLERLGFRRPATPTVSVESSVASVAAVNSAALMTLHNQRVAANRPTFVRMGFDGARTDSLTLDWDTGGELSVDDLIRWGQGKLIKRCRDLETNDAEFRHYLRLLANGVVGPKGFKFQMRVLDDGGEPIERVNKPIEGMVRGWSRRAVTLDGRLPFVPFLRKLMKETARDGETLTRKWFGYRRNPWGFALESIDPTLLDPNYNVPRGRFQPNEIRCAIEVDSFGFPVAYHPWNGPVGRQDRRRIRIPAEEIIHLFDQEVANQTRGIPWGQSIMVSLHQLGKYFNYSLAMARAQTQTLGWLQDLPNTLGGPALTPPMPGGPRPMPASSEDAASAWAALSNPNLQSQEGGLAMEINGITIAQAPPGKGFQGFDPTHPTPQFGPYVKEIRRRNAQGVGECYTMLSGDLEGVNLSSIRYGVEPSRDQYIYLQEWLISSFVQPIFEELLGWSLATGRLRLDSVDRSKYAEFAQWQGRRWKYMDPLKEVQADVLAINASLDTHQGVVGERGGDWEEDVALVAAKERKVKQKLGLPLDVGTTTSGGGAGANSDAQAAADANDEGDNQK